MVGVIDNDDPMKINDDDDDDNRGLVRWCCTSDNGNDGGVGRWRQNRHGLIMIETRMGTMDCISSYDIASGNIHIIIVAG